MGRAFSVATGEYDEKSGLPIARSFTTLAAAQKFARSICEEEITESESIDRRNSMVIKTHKIKITAKEREKFNSQFC